jgi:hypothetical protein
LDSLRRLSRHKGFQLLNKLADKHRRILQRQIIEGQPEGLDGLIGLAQSQSQLAGFQFGSGLIEHYIAEFEAQRKDVLTELRMLEDNDYE